MNRISPASSDLMPTPRSLHHILGGMERAQRQPTRCVLGMGYEENQREGSTGTGRSGDWRELENVGKTTWIARVYNVQCRLARGDHERTHP